MNPFPTHVGKDLRLSLYVGRAGWRQHVSTHFPTNGDAVNDHFGSKKAPCLAGGSRSRVRNYFFLRATGPCSNKEVAGPAADVKLLIQHGRTLTEEIMLSTILKKHPVETTGLCADLSSFSVHWSVLLAVPFRLNEDKSLAFTIQ